jgi:SAM-dependent methyltransferase
MRPTILSNLNTFYETPIGQGIAQESVTCIKKAFNMQSDNILAIGFSGSYLDCLDNGKLYYAAPKSYGSVTNWPKIRPFKTVIIDESRLPFLPETWNTVIVIHFLEYCNNKFEFLNEISRILKKNGKLIIIALNENSIPHRKSSRNRSLKKSINIKKIVGDVINFSFCITNIFGVSKKIKFWPYNFSYNIGKYDDFLISVFPFLSDIVIIVAEKTEMSVSIVETLDPRYES